MPAQQKEVLYTAEAIVEGGRGGHGRTNDGRLEVDFSVPAAMTGDDGPGTNPAQLFALGYPACFQSALLGVAQGRNVDATGSPGLWPAWEPNAYWGLMPALFSTRRHGSR